MKKTFHWFLVLGMVAGLLAALLPTAGTVQGATLGWTNTNLPTTGSTTNRVLDGIKGTVVAVSPDYANDSRVWVSGDSDGDSGLDELYRSTNGGNTWAFADVDGSATNNIVAIVPSPFFATDSTVFVATTVSVFRSTNSGSTFTQLGAAQGSGALVITSMAVSPSYDGTGEIAIGLADTANGSLGLPTGAAGGDDGVRVWGRGSVLNWVTPATNDLSADVTSVAYSPAFSGDGLLMAVASAYSTNSGANKVGLALYHLVGTGSTWNGVFASIQIDVLMLDVGGTDNSNADGGPIVTTSVAIPSDYDASDSSTRLLFVGTTSTDTLGGGSVEDDDGIFRITSTTATKGAIPGGLAEVAVRTLAYSGTMADGTVLATDSGATLANSVYRSTTADTGTTSAAQTYTVRRPVPGLAATTAAAGAGVAVSGTTALAIINSSATTNGGFSRSTDTGNNWVQISHMRNTLITSGATATVGQAVAGTFGPAGFALSPNFSTSGHILMGVSDDAATVDGIFRSTNSGSVWERTDSPTVAANLSFVFGYDPAFATSDTIYYAVVGGNILKRSTNGGLTWSVRSSVACGSNTITSLLAIDGSTVLIGCSAGAILRSINGGFLFTAATGVGSSVVSDLEMSPNYGVDSTILAGTTGRIRISTNGGTSFSALGAIPSTVTLTPVVAFHPDYATNNLAYEGSATAAEGVERINVSTATSTKAWTNIGMTASGTIINGLGFANGGTLYASDSNTAGFTAGSVGGVFSSVTPTQSTAAKVNLSAMGVTTSATNLAANENVRGLEIADNGELWLVIDDPAGSTAADDLRHYTDTINATLVPTNLLPADGTSGVGVAVSSAVIGVTGFTISWDAVSGATGYQYRWSTTSTFTSSTTAAIAASASTRSFAEGSIALAPGDGATTRRVPGLTYYWSARVSAPVVGVWAPAQTITMVLLAGSTAGVPTLVQPNAVNNVAALSSSVALRPLFVWTAVNGATNYEVQVSTDGTFIDASVIVINKIGADQLGNTLAFQAENSLQPGTVYFWRVRGVNSATTGGYPAAAAFTTTLDAAGIGVTADEALLPLVAAGNLELVTSFNYTTALYEAYVPNLAGNVLATVLPNTVIFITVTQDTNIVVSGITYAIQANTPTPIGVGASVTITVLA